MIRAKMKVINWRRWATRGLAVVLFLITIFYVRQAILADTKGPVKLVVYAFSTQEEVLTQRIFPDFEQAWEADTGRELIIEGVFGPSGTLAGQINLGSPADVALLSNEQHVNWLKIGRRVEWDTEPVVVSRTPMVIVTRPANPAHITSFSDLAQPGLRLLHADPRSSGAGDWAVLAVYGSALLGSGDQAQAQAQLEAVWDNVVMLAPSARAALTLFELGVSDALITYEQDARLALARSVPLEIIIPPRTIEAQHVATIIESNVTPPEQAAAQAFINYLLSDAGQQAFTSYHLRPVDDTGEAFPPLVQPFTAAELGGWSIAYPELVEKLWEKKIETRLKLEPAIQLLNSRGELHD
jgi:sulfate transport system substrate-binding protein